MSEQQEQRPPQSQPGAGRSAAMEPRPRDEMADYTGTGLLAGKRALITGGDSGIGRAVAAAFAKEGADVAIAYLDEHDDAAHTAKLVEAAGRHAALLPGDLADEQYCTEVVRRTVDELGGLDVLVNHVGTQTVADDLTEITTEQWDYTFKVNIYSFFWVTKAALPHLGEGSAIVNTA